jgi:hypothetical protein
MKGASETVIDHKSDVFNTQPIKASQVAVRDGRTVLPCSFACSL